MDRVATFEDGGRDMRNGRRSFHTTASLAISWIVGVAACGGSASPDAFSRPPPFVYDAGVIPPVAGADASDSGAALDAPIDRRVPPAPAVGEPAPTVPAHDAGGSPPVVHDAGGSPPVAPPPAGKPVAPPPPAARDAAVDAPELGPAKIDAATPVVPVDATAPVTDADASSGVAPTHVFVIAMENESADAIYGSVDAPYINKTLLPSSASASAFADELPTLPSEPHYVWMEAGTNVFSDHAFTTDDSPSAANSTASTQHLVTQIRAAGRGLDWMSYQQGMVSGECPVVGAGVYVPRHDPTLFFQDVSGAPPSGGNAYCASHHRPLSELAGDLAAGRVASYVFITPDLCHDMHGSPLCPSTADIRAGDDWLASALPPLIAYVGAHGGVIFITWDEGSPLPFIAVGPHVKAGYRSNVPFHHGSMLKTVEEILQLPILPTVQNVSDLSDLFAAGAMP